MDKLNLAPFGTILSAFGCQTAYNSLYATLTIKEAPSASESLIERLIGEISHYDDCSNYVDGVSSLCVADYIDDEVNPVSQRARFNILEALGIMKDDKFIHQVLVLQKNNRSWHHSMVPNDCSPFGDICTHRGIRPDPERKGRTSSRQPNQYHTVNARGVIAREQLVTPALAELFNGIPEENLASHVRTNAPIEFDFRVFRELDIEDKLKVIEQLQGEIA